MFTRVIKLGYNWKDQILNKNTILASCLITYQKKLLTDKEKFQIYTYTNLRVIPLVVALLTSSVCMIFMRNTFTTLYLYLALQYVYSEYLYQDKTSK